MSTTRPRGLGASRPQVERDSRCPLRVHPGQGELAQGWLELVPSHGTHAWIAGGALNRDEARELDEVPGEEEAARLEYACGF